MLSMETMAKRWEDAYAVAPWLSDFFSSDDGKELMEDFRTECEKDSLLDPEILPFILICYVLPEPYWQKLPSQAERKETAKLLNKAAREIRNLSTSKFLGSSESTSGVVEQLTRWVDLLRGHPRLMISPKFHIIDERPSPRRHRARRRVVFFLDGYFRAIGRKPLPWPLITKVLKATKLAESKAKVKNIDNWWLTVIDRELRQEEPLKPAQDKQVQLFYEMKQMVSEGFEGTMVLKWEADM